MEFTYLYYIIDSKILKIHNEIFHIFTTVQIWTAIFYANNFVFKMARFVKAANQFSPLLKEKIKFLCPKMEILQENINMIYKHFLSRKNNVIQ